MHFLLYGCMQKSVYCLLILNLSFILFKQSVHNWTLLVIFIPFLVGLIGFQFQWKEWIWLLIAIIFIGAWAWFYPSNFSIQNLNAYLVEHTHFYDFKDRLIHYVQQSIPDVQISNFVTYLMFNYVDPSFKDFQHVIYQMGISHLFVISGLHINFVLHLWDKLTKKWCPFWLTCLIRILICLWFGYCLSFSISCVRVLIQSCLKCFRKWNAKTNLGVSGLIHGFFFNQATSKYGFLFSYGCTGIALLIFETKIHYQFVKTYLTNLLCYLFTLPLVINLNHQINFLSFLFNLLLSPFLILVFAGILILMLLPYAYYLFYLPIKGFLFLIQWLNQLNLIIHIKTLPKIAISCYYFLISNLFIATLLMVPKPNLSVQSPIKQVPK